MKKCIILRGLPGSGKTTRAEELSVIEGVICSMDHYWVRDGRTYDYRPRELDAAKAFCRGEVEIAFRLEVPVIVIDNTNITAATVLYYKGVAERAGYEVSVETVGAFTPEAVSLYAERNVHGVSAEIIARMANNFEPL